MKSEIRKIKPIHFSGGFNIALENTSLSPNIQVERECSIFRRRERDQG